MRKEIKTIDRPSLTVHVEYDHLTVGELGNIFIRLQAALRSIAGLSPGEYDGRYHSEQPRFVTSTVHTKDSIEISLRLAILSLALAIPGAIYTWQHFSADVFRWFKVVILAMGHGEIEDPNGVTKGLKINITRGEINLSASRQFLDSLTPKQKRAISNFIWSLTGPARKVFIGDDESEISIQWSEEDNTDK